MFDMVAYRQTDTWDVQLAYAAMLEGKVMALPNVNLTENIGFGPDATHYVQQPATALPLGEMTFPLQHVPLEVDGQADAWLRRHHFQVELRTQQVLARTSPGFQDYVQQIIALQREPQGT